MNSTIRFEDGQSYERYMGRWSQLVGEEFLTWLKPLASWRWLDVGCGNGAFTELLAAHAAPAAIAGIDPSEAQLAFARSRAHLRDADFRVADAMALPFPDASFDAAIMPLVIFFVPDPAQGVREMTRVVRSGGLVAAYAWDMEGRGFPYAALQTAMRDLDMTVLTPPSASSSRADVLHDLWSSAGLASLKSTEITVQRTFENFADYWQTIQGGPSVGPTLRSLPPERIAELHAQLQSVLPADVNGRITYSARANVVVGRVP